MLTQTLQGRAAKRHPANILIVSSRTEHLKALMRVLDAASARVFAAFSLRQAEQALSRHPFAVVFCDDSFSDGSYRELLSVCAATNKPHLVLLLRSGEWREYLEAMQQGVFDVLRCPLQPAEVEAALLRALTGQGAQRAALPDAKISPKTAPLRDLKIAGSLNQEAFEELFQRAAQTQKSSASPAPVPPQRATGDRPAKKLSRDVA